MMRSMVERTLNDETLYRVLRLLASNPGLSQRELARELDVSLGKINYSLKALAGVGYIKVKIFRDSDNKKAYLYKLTSKGVMEKTKAGARFLEGKQAEFERLAEEIFELRGEIAGSSFCD